MLAAKPSFAGSVSASGLANNTMQSGMPTSRRIPNLANPAHNFASPTESEFSEPDGPDAVKNWDEDKVCDYLVSVKCGEYEKLFRKNHINGDNLLEMDKEVLKEMGIDKVGDRVRLFLCIKKLRTRAYGQKRRNRVSLLTSSSATLTLANRLINQDSFAALEPISISVPTSSVPSSSPRPLNTRATQPIPANRRYSRQIDLATPIDVDRPSSRPTSPPLSGDMRTQRPTRVPVGGYPSSTTPTSAARQPAPSEPSTARLPTTHTRNNSSMDGSLMAALPQGQDVIRAISTNGVTKVVKIADCNTCEDVMRVTLRKFALREDHERNYCFWVLTGLEPDPRECRRLGDTELWRIIKDQRRPEPNRLLLRYEAPLHVSSTHCHEDKKIIRTSTAVRGDLAFYS